MKYLLMLLLLVSCADDIGIEPYEQDQSDLNPAGRYIVVLKDNSDANLFSKRYNLAPSAIYNHAIKGFAASLPEDVLLKLLNEKEVKYIETDNLIKGSISLSAVGKPSSGCSAEPAQVVPYGIVRVGGPLSAVDKTAWVIDTGIDLTNCDLTVDVSRSKNFVATGVNSPNDGNGHGTHIAGTIAAKNNGIDVVGVAAGATVVAVRVLDNRGSGYISWVIAGVDYVAGHAVAGDAANMSLGASGHFQSLHDAVYNAANLGILFAIAAGNDASDTNNYEPAHVEHPNVYTVSAMDNSNAFAWFSNWGNPPVDFAAPGVNVVSLKKGGGITTMSGTSMATPHLTGLLLLGQVYNDGYVLGDTDGNPDPIAHH